jgi:hypothetical protein
MDYQEAMDQLTRLRSLLKAGGDDSVFSPDDIAIIEELHKEETGQKVRECGCRDRYADAVLILYKTLNTRKQMANEQKYRLRPGVIIWIGTEAYSRHNLTDEVAAAYLTKFPEARGKFERVPKEHKSKAVKALIKETEQEG